MHLKVTRVRHQIMYDICFIINQLLVHFCYTILSPHLHSHVMLDTLVHVRMYSAKQLTWSGLGYTVQWQDGVTTEACSLPVIKDQWHLNLKASILIIFSSHHVFHAWLGTSQDLQSVTKYLDKCIIERWYPGLGLFKILLQFQYYCSIINSCFMTYIIIV